MNKIQEKVLFNFRKIRIYGVFLVVLGHSINIYTDFWNVFLTEKNSMLLNNLGKYIYSFHMPLFFFMSGSIFAYCYYEKNKKNFLKEKALNLMVPFYFIGILYLIPIRYIVEVDDNLKFSISRFLLGIGNGHLWFLWTLFNIFLVIRFVIKFSYKKTLIVLYLLNMISLKIPNYLMISKTFMYLFWFYLGYLFWLNKNTFYIKIKNKELKLLNSIIIVSIVLFLISNLIFKGNKNLLEKLFMYNLKNVITILLIFKTYLIFELYFLKIDNKYLEKIDNYGFGVYLLHEPIIYILIYKINKFNINPFICAGIYFIVSIIGSILLIRIYSKFKENLNIKANLLQKNLIKKI